MRTDYDAIEAVNWSTLRELRRSPMHYRHRLAHPMPDSSTFVLGRATHTAVLEPRRFLRDYALWEGERRAGKAWEAFKAANEGKTLLKADEYDLCCAIADAVQARPAAAELFRGGEAEKTLTWTDVVTGIACKGRVDYLGAALADLKTCRTIDARRFGAAAWDLGQVQQLAFYRRGLRALGMDRPVKIVAVEKDAPHDVAVFDLDDGVLATADEEVGELLQRLVECRASNKWPGRYEEPQLLTLPGWLYSADEDDAAALGLDISAAA